MKAIIESLSMEMTEENTRKKTKKFSLSIRRGYIGLVLSQVVKVVKEDMMYLQEADVTQINLVLVEMSILA